VDLAVAQQRPLQIAKLVEAEKRVIAGAAEVAVVGRALLLAVGRTDRTVHVQDQLANRLVFADPIHQHTGQVAQRLEVVWPGEGLRLESTHLAGGGSGVVRRSTANHLTHGGIDTEPLGVVGVLVAGQTAVDRLTQQSGQAVPGVPARP
jgi:hypothetical protein